MNLTTTKKSGIPYILENPPSDLYSEKKIFTELKYCKENYPIDLIYDFVKIEGSKLTLILNAKAFEMLRMSRDGCGFYCYDAKVGVICGYPFRIDTTTPENTIVIEEIIYEFTSK